MWVFRTVLKGVGQGKSGAPWATSLCGDMGGRSARGPLSVGIRDGWDWGAAVSVEGGDSRHWTRSGLRTGSRRWDSILQAAASSHAKHRGASGAEPGDEDRETLGVLAYRANLGKGLEPGTQDLSCTCQTAGASECHSVPRYFWSKELNLPHLSLVTQAVWSWLSSKLAVIGP